MKKYKPIIISTILSISGGLMDTYSYLCRGGVFANAQTGNILLLSINLANGDVRMALYYLYPILHFIFGVLISLIINRQHIILLFEAILLSMVCIIPDSYNLVANNIISLVCGMQLESFNEIYDNKIATTMCIGNLKSSIEYLYAKGFTKSLLYCWIIMSFIVGVIIGNIAIRNLQHNSLLICTGLLLIVMILIDDKYNQC